VGGRRSAGSGWRAAGGGRRLEGGRQGERRARRRVSDPWRTDGAIGGNVVAAVRGQKTWCRDRLGTDTLVAFEIM
jgi:hypothetical protein